MSGLRNGRPKVTACVVTYNQEGTIGKCIQSLLDQAVDLDLEIVVGDDCSKDGTRSVIQSFVESYPGLVRPIFHERNQGPTRNYLAVHAAARGEYVAHVDGDDYALPGKLARQANYLDAEPDCIAVVHRLALIREQGKPLGRSWPNRFVAGKYDLVGLVRNHPLFGHSSLMYRNGAYAGLHSNPGLREIVDFYIYVHLASQGRIGAIDQDLGEYTVGVGISTKKNLYELVEQAMAYASRLGLSEDDYRFASARQYLIFAEKALLEGDIVLFKHLMEESVTSQCISLRQMFLFVLGKHKVLLKASEWGYRWTKQRLSP
jgi:glycosyltransferase involved in cell wall biosynthesis